jgi:hypothetical protein
MAALGGVNNFAEVRKTIQHRKPGSLRVTLATVVRDCPGKCAARHRESGNPGLANNQDALISRDQQIGKVVHCSRER